MLLKPVKADVVLIVVAYYNKLSNVYIDFKILSFTDAYFRSFFVIEGLRCGIRSKIRIIERYSFCMKKRQPLTFSRRHKKAFVLHLKNCYKAKA